MHPYFILFGENLKTVIFSQLDPYCYTSMAIGCTCHLQAHFIIAINILAMWIEHNLKHMISNDSNPIAYALLLLLGDHAWKRNMISCNVPINLILLYAVRFYPTLPNILLILWPWNPDVLVVKYQDIIQTVYSRILVLIQCALHALPHCCVRWVSQNSIKACKLRNIWLHDDVIKWNRFPRYWPFVRGIHRSPVKSHRPVTRSFGVFYDLRLNEGLSKQSGGWWFETLTSPLWRHCNVFMKSCNVRNIYTLVYIHHYLIWLRLMGILCHIILLDN